MTGVSRKPLRPRYWPVRLPPPPPHLFFDGCTNPVDQYRHLYVTDAGDYNGPQEFCLNCGLEYGGTQERLPLET